MQDVNQSQINVFILRKHMSLKERFFSVRVRNKLNNKRKQGRKSGGERGVYT